MILSIVMYSVLAFIAYRLFQHFQNWRQYKSLVAQGVSFPNGFSYMQDLLDLQTQLNKEPTGFHLWPKLIEEKLGVSRLPALCGTVWFGVPYLNINSVELL
jgi:hypothetical protein